MPALRRTLARAGRTTVFAVILPGCGLLQGALAQQRAPTLAEATTMIRTTLDDGIPGDTQSFENLELDDGVLAKHPDIAKLLDARHWLSYDRDGAHLNALARAASQECIDPPAPDCRVFVLGHPTFVRMRKVFADLHWWSSDRSGLHFNASALAAADDCVDPDRRCHSFSLGRATLRTHAIGSLAVAIAKAGLLRCLDAHDISRSWRGTVDFHAVASFMGHHNDTAGFDYCVRDFRTTIAASH